MKSKKRNKFLRLIIMAIVIISLTTGALTGCSLRAGKVKGAGDVGEALIVTSFYPIYIATINITRGIEEVRVENLTRPQTGCLHDYQMKPQDVELLDLADVFVVNGLGMESFLDKAVAQKQGLKILDASKEIQALADGNGEINSHVWLDVDNEIAQAQNIAEGLSAAFPKVGNAFRNNAEIYIEKLRRLAEAMKEGLKAFAGREIVTFHEAFPYFAQEFGLKIAAVIEREPGVAPSPREVERTIAAVRRAGVKVLFAEPQYSQRAADAIAAETGARIFLLDPIVTGDANLSAYDDYLIKMRRNMDTIIEAMR